MRTHQHKLRDCYSMSKRISSAKLYGGILMLYSRENTLRLLGEYMASLRTCRDGEKRLQYIKRINELQEELSKEY